MAIFNWLTCSLFLSIIVPGTAISYNLPKFCANATWNASAVTFATATIVGGTPYGIFVSSNNTVYVANRESSRVHVWLEGSTTPISNISNGLSNPYSVFVTDNGNIYVDNGASNKRVDQWQLNSNGSVPVLFTCDICYDLFVDSNNYIYCSMTNYHEVIGKTLDIATKQNVWSIVAGTGSAGSTTTTLSSPRGIFVDVNFNLYVADSGNARVQQFSYRQQTGTTIAGAAAAGTISLSTPTDVALDADGYLFIVDSENQRIVGSGPYGFRCIAGCTQSAGSASSQMDSPSTFGFDSYGNIYITDRDNNRVQKFLLSTNVCNGSTTSLTSTTTAPSTATTTTTSSTLNSFSNTICTRESSRIHFILLRLTKCRWASAKTQQKKIMLTDSIISYNQPKLSPYAIWVGTGITFAASTTVGADVYGIFVDKNNTVYVASKANNRILIWLEGSISPRNITVSVGAPYSIFVTASGDIYVDNGSSKKRVDKYLANDTNPTSVMSVTGACYDMFIDISNNLYCSLYDYHQVAVTSLNDNSTMWNVAAGVCSCGSTQNKLCNPRGIFVDTSLNLYVADCTNNRVQLFQSGQINAITVVSASVSGTISLACPSDVAFDADGYMFIVDSNNDRIVGSGPNGFRCLVGCTGTAGSTSSDLYNPSTMSFDSYGNIYVTDRSNSRVQKFILQPNTTYPFSFNQPNFCPYTTWNTEAVTFVDVNLLLSYVYGVFVDINNTIYVANWWRDQVNIWAAGSTTITRNLTYVLDGPLSLFATCSGDLYVDNGLSYARVDKWGPNDTISTVSISNTVQCYDLFVDISNNLYCSLTASHKVAKKWLGTNDTTKTIVAGTGGYSAAATDLYYPCGIYVDYQFNLYIGDCGNDRIQKFALGQTSATTIAGNGAPGTITLDCPNDIAFDSNGYLFITDNYNHRLIGSGPFGFRCLLGCTKVAGSLASQLYYPRTFGFDTYGNIYIADQANLRVQKLLLATNSCTISYNQPVLCVNSIWNPNATTFTSVSTIGASPYGIFIDGINSVYIPSRTNNTIFVWSQYDTTPTRNNSGNLNRPHGIFVSLTGDIYIDNGYSNGRVDKFSFNSSTVATVMSVNGTCFGLFIDINNYLYCSLHDFHQVVKVLLNSSTITPTVVIGNSTAGSDPTMLDSPYGIYVDSNLNLYIADCGNDRIQSVSSGSTGGITLVGNSSSLPTITLDCPTGVVLDNNGYLFIVDSYNNRIVGSGLYGYRCIVGCSSMSGTSASQLSLPQTMAFDSYGNIYVTDQNNSRVQITYKQQLQLLRLLRLPQLPRLVLPLVPRPALALVHQPALPPARQLALVLRLVLPLVPRPALAPVRQLLRLPQLPRLVLPLVPRPALAPVRQLLRLPQLPRLVLALVPRPALAPARQLLRLPQLPRLVLPLVPRPALALVHQPALPPARQLALALRLVLQLARRLVLPLAPQPARAPVRRLVGPQLPSLRLALPPRLARPALQPKPLLQQLLQKQVSNHQLISTEEPQSTTNLPTTQQSIILTCYPPAITLIPSGSSLTSPLQFRKNQDFSIDSMIQFRCNGSLSTIKQWTVSNCTSTSCQYRIHLSQKIQTTFSEFYVPAKTLDYGLYQLVLTVIMATFPSAKSSAIVYIMVTPSGITANPVALGTSMITRGYDQDLELNPGLYSVDPDEDSFDASKWKYAYYCRWYGSYNFPNMQGQLLTIENSKIDPLNPSCLSNRSDNDTGLIFGNLISSPKSSLTILSGTLRSNQMYQFMVYMENKKNASIQATGYVIVTVEDTRPQLVVIGCVISTLCSPNLEFQVVNPTTQVALYALCVGFCQNIVSIHWNIYQGDDNSSANSTHWNLFQQMTIYDDIWFFGRQMSNFTATDQLFLNNPAIQLWRFEVVYTFTNETSTSALNFVINQSPSNGSCVITPHNGTTSTSFTVTCPNWYDEDGIKGYSLYAWQNDVSEMVMIAFSSVTQFQLQLPAGNEQTAMLNLVVYVRDLLDCVTEVNMSAVHVIADTVAINQLMESIQISSSSTTLSDNPTVQLLSSGNQNIVGQVLTSFSQQLNLMENTSVAKATSSGISAATVSVASLTSQNSVASQTTVNESALVDYNKELNSQASLRDYLVTFISNLAITTSNSITLQSSSLAQLTQSTNQLTRATLTLASERCYELAVTLNSKASRIPFEDVQAAANQLTQCASNVLTGVNGPLQGRTISLDLDTFRANDVSSNDYDTDIESEWSSINSQLTDDADSSTSIEQQRNLYYQQKLASQIQIQSTQIISLVTAALNVHLNLGQTSLVNTSQTFMSLETTSIESLANKTIKQLSSAAFYLPSNFTLNTTSTSSISLRSKMDTLAAYGNFSNTNLSRSVSLTFVDNNGNDIPFLTDSSSPIKIIIPRDPNVVIPSMYLQNVTTTTTTSINSSTNSSSSHLLFRLHYINITSSLAISVHFEIQSLNLTLAHLFIYKFDQTPQLNSSIKSIDGWTIFCPSMLDSDNIYKYYLDNQKTSGHQSLIFGIRELSEMELHDYCSATNTSFNNNTLPITDTPCTFTADYALRIYTSGCYYLDENNNWKSDGLIVGPSTNHYETECFSSHLTTFAGGFIVLPAPINWSYVFANADFSKNKTIYLTMICTSILYVILLLYSRFKDRKDIEKLGVTPMIDNHKQDQYFYQILIFTGQRSNAGTKSKVYFVLSGDEDQTDIRALADPQRKVLQRGGIDAFVMAVPKSLGLLNYVRIWHDNSGEGQSASWYLKYIIVRDLQTMDKFYFIAQRWFAVEKDDGRIERTLPVAGELEKQAFSYVLSKKAYHSASDGHLWFSIFSRPPSNRFTRVQRCTCCFVLFFISMLLNIMYYDLSNEAKSTNTTQINGLAIGPLYITPQQIAIGVMVELLTLVPSLFIVQFFRRIRSRQQISPLQQTLYKIKTSGQTLTNLEQITKQKKRPTSGTFPWWCIFIAYTLSFMIIVVSIFFIIVRGIEFGDVKTQKWLTSVLTGFFSSILV
ncbi:unnamed protein product, partial [Adineta ricciae]